MIPVKLTIQGLYSYQKKQTIDFETLTQAHLFGIFGSVGSGKSAILEAITFALYGKTDRLNLSGDNRNYNMMNLKSNELLIEFEFKAGKSGTSWLAVVQGRRNSKRFEDVKALERSAFMRENGTWLPVECSRLEEATGLSYDNFKRTIIIPQGRFQEFLQLGNKERTQMMKELFHLHKFELYYNVTSLEYKNNEQLQNLKGQIQQIGDADPEQVNALGEKLEQLKKEAAETEARLQSLQKKEAQWQQLHELVIKYENASKILLVLKEQEAEYTRMENDLRNYEKCAATFRNILELYNKSSEKINQKKNYIENESEKLRKLKAESFEVEKLLVHIKTDYENRQNLHLKALELEKLLKIRELNNEAKILTERYEKGKEILTRNHEESQKIKEDKDRIMNQVQELKNNIPDFNLLSSARSWHILKQEIDKSVLSLHKDTENIENKVSTIDNQINEILRKPVFKGLNESAGCLEAARFLHSQNETLRESLKKHEKQADQLRVNARLEEYASQLHDGSPCPLCGSEHHPLIYSAESNSQEQARLEETLRTIEETIQSNTLLVENLTSLNHQLKLYSENHDEIKLKQDNAKKEQEQLMARFSWPGFEKLTALDKAFAEGTRMQEVVKQQELELTGLIRKTDKLQADRERFLIELERIKDKIIKCQAETDTLQNQLTIIESNRKDTDDQVRQEIKMLSDKYVSLEKEFNDLTARQTNLQRSVDILTGTIEALEKELKQENEVYDDLARELEKLLGQSGYHSMEEVKQILAKQIDTETQNSRIEMYRRNLALAANKKEELQQELGNRSYDEKAHQSLKEEIASVGKDLAEKHQERGNISGQLIKLQKDLQNLSALKQQIEKLELRNDNIRVLKSLFKGSGFVGYVSSVYLRNLCNAANERFFKLTRQKLSLEMTEDNSFQVRDYLNGGKVRSVKTLSGGQTFQASLSLALALADNIRQMNESHRNFFFLDEGFGSLDHESLQIVFNTLRSLRDENRVVGVISHVEEMQQEIDIHLRIENTEDQGSIIRQSWNT